MCLLSRLTLSVSHMILAHQYVRGVGGLYGDSSTCFWHISSTFDWLALAEYFPSLLIRMLVKDSRSRA